MLCLYLVGVALPLLQLRHLDLTEELRTLKLRVG